MLDKDSISKLNQQYRFTLKSITPFFCIQYINNAYEEIKKEYFSLIYFSRNHLRMRGTDARECSIFFLRENATKSEVRVMRCQSVCVCSAGGFSIISSSFCQVCSGCSVQIGLAVSFFIYFIFLNFISYFVVFIFWSEKGCIFTLLFLPALLGRASVRPDASSCSPSRRHSYDLPFTAFDSDRFWIWAYSYSRNCLW